MFQQVLGPLQGTPGRKVVPEIPIEFKIYENSSLHYNRFSQAHLCNTLWEVSRVFRPDVGKAIGPTEHSGVLRKTAVAGLWHCSRRLMPGTWI